MDVKAFQYFEAVCRHRNVSRAAAELGISPQGLSGSMTRLAQDVGAPLLVASEGMVEPTAYGRAVLACAGEVNASLAAMRREISALIAHDRRLVRLGAITGSLGYLGEGLVEEFNEACSDAQVLVVCESTNVEVVRRLQDGECDVAVLADKPDGTTRSMELVRDNYFLWVSTKNALSRHGRLSLEDLAGQTLAIYDLEPGLTDPFVLAVRKSGVPISLRFVGEIIRVFELAHENRAVGLTCRNHVEATRGTDVVGIPFDLFDMTYRLCWRTDCADASGVQAFLRFMEGRRTRYGKKVG